jgi:hypothetical protein
MKKKLILFSLTLLFLIQPAIANEYEDLMKMLEIKKDLPLEQKKFIAEDLMMFKANPQSPSKVDWGCLNICKDAIKGVRISEINSFCLLRCTIK